MSNAMASRLTSLENELWKKLKNARDSVSTVTVHGHRSIPQMPLRFLRTDHGIYRVAARSKLWCSLGSSEWIDGKGEIIPRLYIEDCPRLMGELSNL